MKLIKKFAVLFAALLVLFTASCGEVGKVDTNCETGWTINKYETKNASTGETAKEDQFACFQLTLNSEKAEELWLNFGAVYIEEVEIVLNRYNSSDYSDYSSATYKKSVTITKTQIEESEKGWVKVADGLEFGSSYLKVSFYGGVKVNEMVVINGKGKKVSFSLKAAKMILKDENGTIYGKPYYTAEEIEGMTLKEGSPLNFNDEQDKFDKK